jgi:OOP family OmpA-OmpF porin
VFLFSDGEFTGGRPGPVAKRLATTYDVCFYVISTARPEGQENLREFVASLNNCSRVISFEDFINRPEYTTGVLWDVKVTEDIVTSTESKIVGLKVNNIHFATDESTLSDADKAELDELAAYVKGHEKAYAVVAGYTDSAGSADHNVGLSRRRTDMVATYMKEKHGWTDSHIVMLWYGAENPIAPNDSPENMAKNRRVEVTVSGL